MRSDLPERISKVLTEDTTWSTGPEGANLAARVALTWFIEALNKYSNLDDGMVPLAHTEDCTWASVTGEVCDCGFDDLHYDLIWARMYPTPRKEETDE